MSASSVIAAVVYRQGSAVVPSAFFTELLNEFGQLTIFVEPLLVVSDININPERSEEPSSARFKKLIDAYDLMCRVTASTHKHGWLLDVVIARGDLGVFGG